VVTAYLSLTQERTRAVGTPTQINVTKVTGTADGVLTVEVNTKNLPADYWATAENANLFIRINDGNNDVISEMIPTFYTVLCELPEGYEFNTAVHAQLADDTKAIKFIANSKVVTEHQIGTSPAYMQLNGTTLEIHTAAKEFIFNKDCIGMFSTLNDATKFANITTIDFNGCINTSKVTDMWRMFYGCQALNSLNLSNFNTANVTDMRGMFNMCKALNSLNLNSFDTAKVTDMGSMFYQCEALESLDLSSFDTANVTNMSGMFYACKALKSLNLSSFNTANVTDMSSMFFYCKTLESLDLSGFDTANVTNMSGMFRQCKALESLDIRNFNMEKVTSSDMMFLEVGSSYNNRTFIKVTMALKAALDGKSVYPGPYAEYYITDQQSGLNDFGFGGHFSN
jgi:surface protein